MKARRTPWWHYVIGLVVGLVCGAGIAVYGERTGLALIGVSWLVIFILAVMGVGVLLMALQVHKYTNTDPKKRAMLKPFDPQKAVTTLVLCKALGLAGAVLAGWYGGQILMSVNHVEAEFYRQAVIECAVAVIVCLADMIVGIVGEWLCQLPPLDGPESAKMKAKTQRQYGRQATATKTMSKTVSEPSQKTSH